jgi:dTDP-4-amino-4,6-dideoxygalactose transaminase
MIPDTEPLVGESESKYVLECLRTGWSSSKSCLTQFFFYCTLFVDIHP